MNPISSTSSFLLKYQGKTLDLSQPKIMGIVNATPDSFSDNGAYYQFTDALKHVERLLREGADIIDIGGESTRPNAPIVTLEEELGRVIPLIKAVHEEFNCWISIDTSKAEVIKQAVEVGANMINDVRALSEPEALATAAELNLPTCIMHMQGTPQTMQNAPKYQNIIDEVSDYLAKRAQQCIDAGISRENIILDPGFGFGKTTEHNYQLLANFKKFEALGYPLLAGISRKSMLGHVTGKDVEQRVSASISAALLATERGAHILRVHDVAETKDALLILQAVRDAE